MLGVVSSCKKKDDATPQSTTSTDTYHTVPSGKTWCNGPSDPTQQLTAQNSYVLLTEQNPNSLQKIIWIDNGDTIGPFVPIEDNVQIGRKFYCAGDYDTFQWKHTDTLGNNWTNWKRDTVKYIKQTQIFY